MNVFQKHTLLACTLLVGMCGFSSVNALDFADLDGESKLITVGDPMNPKYANAGRNLRNGVGSLYILFEVITEGGFICTAAAISPIHVLTAAHCVTEADFTVSRIRFILNAGLPEPMILDAAGFAVHPWYPVFLGFGFGAFAHGDIAVLELEQPLPEEIEFYELYRDEDEFNQKARHYGHGGSGKGNKGRTGGTDFFFARTGLNRYEQVLEPFLGTGIPDQLLYDFDSGGSRHNAMAWWFSSQFRCAPEHDQTPPQAQDGQCTTFKDGKYPDFKGFRKFEIGLAGGDSGGPAFIDDKIAGVHSFGFTHRCTGVTNGTDFTCGLDSSFGEMNGDTRVSYHADFIDAVMGGAYPVTPIGAPAVAAVAESNSAAANVLTPNGAFFINGVYSNTMRARVE